MEQMNSYKTQLKPSLEDLFAQKMAENISFLRNYSLWSCAQILEAFIVSITPLLKLKTQRFNTKDVKRCFQEIY